MLVLHGELDIAAREPLPRRVTQVAGAEDVPIVIDLSGVGFMDSRGLKTLIDLQAGRPSLRFRNPSTAVRRVLEMTGLAEHLSVEVPTDG